MLSSDSLPLKETRRFQLPSAFFCDTTGALQHRSRATPKHFHVNDPCVVRIWYQPVPKVLNSLPSLLPLAATTRSRRWIANFKLLRRSRFC